MKCKYCNGKQKVIDVVHNEKENKTYRAKKCTQCGALSYTVECETIYNQTFAEEWTSNHRRYRKEKENEQ